MIDYTKILEKLNPSSDGEDYLRLRSGIVMAINTDGTVDVQISGVTIVGVQRIADASLAVGAVVQILSYRGGLLVLGRTASSDASSGLGLWARVSSIVDSAAIPTSFTTVLTTPVRTFVRNRVYDCRMLGGVNTATTGTSYAGFQAWRTGPDTLIGDYFAIPITGSGAVFRAAGGGVLFTPGSVDVTGQVSLKMRHSAATVFHKVATGTPRYLEVWDVGDVSQFDNVTVW